MDTMVRLGPSRTGGASLPESVRYLGLDDKAYRSARRARCSRVVAVQAEQELNNGCL